MKVAQGCGRSCGNPTPSYRGSAVSRCRGCIVSVKRESLAPYFKKRVLEVATPRPGIKWFVVDGGPINVIESTGAAMLEALAGDLRARGIRLGFANLRTEVQGLLEHSGVKAALRERARFSGKQPALQGGHRRFARSGRAEVVQAFKHGKSRGFTTNREAKLDPWT